MATFSIKSRNHGEVRFYCADRDHSTYITVTRSTDDGPQWYPPLQPCEGGGFRGNTLMASPKTLEKKARNWWKQYLQNQRQH